jgi:hypothetical protein
VRSIGDVPPAAGELRPDARAAAGDGHSDRRHGAGANPQRARHDRRAARHVRGCNPQAHGAVRGLLPIAARESSERWRRIGEPKVATARSSVQWRATIDEDGPYCFAVAL